jgi:hypothetical protein
MMGQQPLTKCVTRPLAPTLATCQKENQREAKNGLLLGTGQEGHSAHGNRRRINLLTEAVPSGGDATFRGLDSSGWRDAEKKIQARAACQAFRERGESCDRGQWM